MDDFKLDPFENRAARADEKRRAKLVNAAKSAARERRTSEKPRSRKRDAELRNWLATQPWYVNAGPLAKKPIVWTDRNGASRMVRRYNPTLPAVAGTVQPWSTVVEPPKTWS